MLFSNSANPEHRNYATWEDIQTKYSVPLNSSVELIKTLTSVSKKTCSEGRGGRNSQVFRTEFDKDNIFAPNFTRCEGSVERQIKNTASKILDGKAMSQRLSEEKDLNQPS